MGLRISTNMASISSQRALSGQTKRQEKAAQSLATGNRITKASDDSAGFAIAENMKMDIRGTQQAKSNALNAVSTLQVAEGSLSETANLLGRLKELGVQSASDTVGETERGYLNQEATSLAKEIERISNTTEFGGRKLLDGSGPEFDFHVGAGFDDNNVISHTIEGNTTLSGLGLTGVDITSKSGARDLLENLDGAINSVSKMRAGLGAIQSRLEATGNVLSSREENVMAARSRLMDADVAKEAADLASASMLQSAAVSVLSQANQQPYVAMKLLG
ncbi:MAG: flagellin [Pseudobdellovibrio sp.]